jgi:hypothetical protein
MPGASLALGNAKEVTMSQWNYTQCAKPFSRVEEAREYMISRGFEGQILARDNGGYTAVCPTYPEGFYPDAVPVATVTLDSPTLLPVINPSEACCS